MKERILEIQFFFFCRRFLFYKKNRNLNALLKLFETMNWTKNYNCETLSNIAIDMFVNKNNLPTIVEYCTIYDLNETRIPETLARKYFNMDRKEFRKQLTLARIKNLDIRSIYPRYPKEAHEAIRAFKKTIRNILTWESTISD